jgi:hypothetical protein
MYYKKCEIKKVINNNFNNYNSKYIITINNDIIGFSNTIKEAKKIINDFIDSNYIPLF